MIEFNVLDRFSGSVRFTAEIDCMEGEDTPPSFKLGLAVKWAIKERVDLRGADLGGADLRYTDLRCANLYDASLRNADLYSANLYCIDLRYTDLRYTDLRYANLRSANLRNANLRNTDLRSVNLRDTNLYCTDLRNANLRNADLRNANLRNANLRDANLRNTDLRNADLGNNQKITVPPVFFLSGSYDVMITDAHVKIGCQVHPTADWRAFKSSDIERFGGDPKEWELFKPAILALAEAHQSRFAQGPSLADGRA